MNSDTKEEQGRTDRLSDEVGLSPWTAEASLCKIFVNVLFFFPFHEFTSSLIMQQTLLKLHVKKYSSKLTVTQECSIVSERSCAFTSLLLYFPKSHSLTELCEGWCLSKHQSSLLLIRSKFTLLFETMKNVQIKHDTQTLPDNFLFQCCFIHGTCWKFSPFLSPSLLFLSANTN